MPNIFISYRRDDSAHQIGRIFDQLAVRFGKEKLFQDVDSIPAGADWGQVLSDKLAQSDVMLVFIGDRWLSAADAWGRRRLDSSDDFVRMEIESALRSNIPVVPVLIGDTRIPADTALPETLRKLAVRKGIRVRPDPDFHHDVDRLVRGIYDVLVPGVSPAKTLVISPQPGPVILEPQPHTPPSTHPSAAPEQGLAEKTLPREARICEEFQGFVEKIEGESAYIRLDSQRGERLCGPYPAAELTARGIGERDRFSLKAVEVNGAIRFDAALIPRKRVSPERQREIRQEIEAGLEGFTPDDER